MDEFKDVLLAEPPSRVYGRQPQGHAQGGGGTTAGHHHSHQTTTTVSSSSSSSAGAGGAAGGGMSMGAGAAGGGGGGAGGFGLSLEHYKGGGAGGFGLSLEHYKGILLCDRPADMTSGGGMGSVSGGSGGGFGLVGGSNGAAPFLPAGVKTGLQNDTGLCPSLEGRSKLAYAIAQRPECLRSKQLTSGPAKKALSRHRQWLHSFASEVKRMKQQEADELDQAKDRMATLRQKFEQERQHVLGHMKTTAEADYIATTSQSARGGGGINSLDSFTSRVEGNGEESVRALMTSRTTTTTTKKKKKGHQLQQKPKWAMTEEEELDEELGDAQDLLDFAANLKDYDKYMQDVEVQQAVAAMKERVKVIAAADGVDIEHLRGYKKRTGNEDYDDGDDNDDGFDDAVSECSVTSSEARLPTPERRARMTAKMEEKRQVRKAARRHAALMAAAASGDVGDGWDGSTKLVHAKLKAVVEADAIELAEKLLKTSPGLGNVHSKQSLARLLKDVTLGGGGDKKMDAGAAATASLLSSRTAADGGGSGIPTAAATVFTPPMVSIIGEDSGEGGGHTNIEPKKVTLHEMRHSKTHVQNLPYMYRCPSI